MHTIVRYWNTKSVEPSTASLFFVNSDGWALTAKHVGQTILGAHTINSNYSAFKTARTKLTTGKGNRKAARALQDQYGYKECEIIEVKNSFVNCVSACSGVKVRSHADYDVALIQFEGMTGLSCTEFPIFMKDMSELRQGTPICRIGYPFPEFQNFEYDSSAEEIKWTTTGRQDTPAFPLDGMVTRFIRDETGKQFGFEVSTPGLLGQSGGPAFCSDGRIVGLQYATNHLDLKFDIKTKILRKGVECSAKDFAFLHVGCCIDVEVLKAFMRNQNVSFAEA
jgi:hypothetical protein